MEESGVSNLQIYLLEVITGGPLDEWCQIEFTYPFSSIAIADMILYAPYFVMQCIGGMWSFANVWVHY